MGPEGTAQSESLFTVWGRGKDRGEGKTPFPMSCGPPFLSPFFPNTTPFRNGLEVKEQRGPVPCKLSFGLPRARPVWSGSTPTAGGAGQSPVVPCRSYVEKLVMFTACTHRGICTTSDYFYRNSCTMMLFLTKGESC